MKLSPRITDSVVPVTIAIVAFALYAFFPWATSRDTMLRFNSPDETANYLFSERLATGMGLSIPEPLLERSGGVLHPRSTVAVQATIAPASFIGLPVFYGVIGFVLGIGILPYLTPVVASLALVALWGIWRRLFGERLATLATVLTAIHPAYWYYASRGFYHNVLFLALVIFSAWSFFRFRETRYSVEWLVVCIFFLVGALFVRTVEVLWLLPLLLWVLWKEREHLRITHGIIAGAVLGAFLSLALLGFAVVYSAPLPTGYHQAAAAVASSASGAFITAARSILLPLGFDAGRIIANIFNNGFLLFLPLWLFVAIGFRAMRLHVPRFYMVAIGWVGAWLLVYYGSWFINDSVGFQTVTVSTSFSRYWLPLYVITMPLVAFGVTSLGKQLGRLQLVAALGCLALFTFSFSLVYFDPIEGFTAVAGRLQTYRALSREVNQLTTSTAVIVSDRSDKVFFPDRRVISPGSLPFSMYPEVLTGIGAVADVVPVYVYVPHEVDADTVARLRERQIVLQPPVALMNGGWLYPLLRL
ncbi:MAG: glycosyltransferase family 39 protein [Patescibacteria group bacterium]